MPELSKLIFCIRDRKRRIEVIDVQKMFFDKLSRSEKVNKEDDAIFVMKRYNYLNSSGTFK